MSLTSVQIKMLKRLLLSGTQATIAHALEKIHPSDLTLLFSELSPNETQRLLNALFLVSKAGQVLLELPEFLIPDILELVDDQKLAHIISRLPPDDALFLLEKVEESRWNVLLASFPEAKRRHIDKLLLYPRYSAGTAMTSRVFSLKSSMTVEEAIGEVRKYPETGGLFYLYVVDDAKQLVGVLSLRMLVTSKPDVLIKDVMIQEVYSVHATAPQEEAAQIVSKYNLLAIPVVSETRELVGVITVDDVIDIVEEEATEDIYNLAGLSESDRALTPLKDKVKKRLPWMCLNLITAGIAAFIIGMFEHSIAEVVALAIFLPVNANLGGNVAIQSLTVISRAIALGELSFIKAYKAVMKELGSGMILGTLSGCVMGGAVYFWKHNIYLSLLLLCSTTLTLIIAGLAGALIPVTFHRLKLDPAVGTSVIVSLITDSSGFLFILGLATLMMKWLI